MSTGDSRKEWLKRWVFKCFLKTDIDDADVMFSGRVFHSQAAATGKARSPIVEIRVVWTTSSDVSGDADEPRQQMTGGIPQRGTAELTGVGICIPIGICINMYIIIVC